jgi:enoyl-CoA hydratase/carnithine racemase
MSEVIGVSREGGIAILEFNRESNLNALSMGLARAIVAALVELDADDAVRGVVLTGAGSRAFCAGVDLAEAQAVKVAEVEGWFGTVCAVYRQILATEKPVIAALNGVAAGAGFQIALVSDMRVAHAGVKMGQPEVNAGIPSIMGSHWMRLHLGWARNQELSMTGRLMDAAEAEGLGLINRLVKPDEVVPAARALAAELAAKPSVAFRRTKARFREVAMAGFDAAFRAAVLGQQEAFASGEPQAIMAAFLAKRAGKGPARRGGS